MKPKIIIIVISAAVITLIVFFTSNKPTNMNSPVPNGKKAASNEERGLKDKRNTVSVKNKMYIDPAGFQFSYPDNFDVSKKDSDEETIYSWLNVTSQDSKGSVELKLEDSQLDMIDSWFKNNKEASSDAEINKVKLADLDARQFATDSTITTVALDKSVLIKIKTDFGNSRDVMTTVNDRIVDSFAFKAPEAPQTADGSSGSSGSYDDSVILEGEEIIE